MDEKNRALCYALRNPPKGATKMKYADIAKLVRKKDCAYGQVGSMRLLSHGWRFGARVGGEGQEGWSEVGRGAVDACFVSAPRGANRH